MSGAGDLENVILHVIERWIAGRYTERHGLVTSYDSKKYLAKVTFQPEGQESGWLPIETGHVGQGYGIAMGLQPGSGSGVQGQQQGDSGQSGSDSNGATGDQVIVRYQEGDIESGKIVQRVHSDKDTPPEAKSGELLFWTKFKQDDSPGPDAAADGQSGSKGQQIYFKKDGSLVFTDGNGATITLDGQGNMVFACKKYTVNASDDIKLISAKNALLKGASAILYATGSAFIKAAAAINAKAASNLVDPPWVAGASDPPISG
jgi:phage baseplate assembly protein gpV